jgi:hypothetical protein
MPSIYLGHLLIWICGWICVYFNIFVNIFKAHGLTSFFMDPVQKKLKWIFLVFCVQRMDISSWYSDMYRDTGDYSLF